MFDFLRKYQRILFFIVAGFVFSSFLFFGTFSALVPNTTKESKVVGKLVDGADLTDIELEKMVRFLSGDWQEENPQLRNFLNDGVVRRDILLSGIAQLIVESEFENFSDQFQERLEKARRFKGYQHPHAPFLSSRAIWEKVSPELNRDWASLIANEKSSPDTFKYLASLYEKQRSIPSFWLKNFLVNQERQYSWIDPDPSLQQTDLSLFGFKNVGDWFGSKFLSRVASVILNGAILAEKTGIHVSLGEAKQDLRRLFAEALQSYAQAKIPVSFSYQDHLRMLGIDEYDAVNIWKKVLTFRRWMQRIGSSVLMDSLGAKEFTTLAGQEAVVDVYRFNPDIICKTPVDGLGLFLYWKALFPETVSQLNILPDKEPLPGDVAIEAPELVGVYYKAKIAVTDKREAALLAPFKEVIEYETSDAGWRTIQQKFSFLKNVGGKNAQERFAAIEKLDSTKRSKVDFFTRRQLVDIHPEWVEVCLAKAEPKLQELCLSNSEIHLSYLENSKESKKALGALFKTILTNPEESLAKLQRFESGEAVFRFTEIEKCSDEIVKTFAEAKKDGSIGQLVAKSIGKEGEAKAKQLLHDWNQSSLTEEIWSAKRLYGPAIEARNAQRTGVSASKWIFSENDCPLIAQFKLRKSEERIKRSGKEAWIATEPFALNTNEWSEVHVNDDGDVAFLFLKERTFEKLPLQEQVLGAQEILALDAKQTLAKFILRKMKENDVD